MATHQCKKCCQVLPCIRGNSKGAHTRQTPGSGVRSMKVAKPTEEAPTTLPHQKKNNILITEHKVKSLMYADQTGLFPTVLSLGNKYIMILHHVDSNSSWLEAMQNQSGSKLILARAQALARMQRRGSSQNIKSLTVKHQRSTRPPLRPPA
jgi:hypothetical protein